MTSKLPPSASIATATHGGKLHAPSADRNGDALADLLRRIAPQSGCALEIASGTGQHVTRFASAQPNLIWTPSEISPERIASIKAYRVEADLPNLSTPIHLDACTPGWARQSKLFDLIMTVNLLHLIPETAAKTMISEVAKALAPGGTLMLYGPFLRDGQTISDGDARFHADLRAADPNIGYKDRDAVLKWGQAAGLTSTQCVEMPANNLALIFTARESVP